MNLYDIRAEAKRVALNDGVRGGIDNFSYLVKKYYIHINTFNRVKESNDKLRRENELLQKRANNCRHILKRLGIDPDDFMERVAEDEGTDTNNNYRGPLMSKIQ